MRDMEGKICDIRSTYCITYCEKVMFAHRNHNSEEKYIVLSNFIKT